MTAARISGADALLSTLVAGGVEVCFANPGTTEMHLVAALDAHPGMRAVLTLFEGVATGAADGYARMAGRPAATLLHLGPGLANGLANLHNARRARTGVVNIVGNHSTWHTEYDAPLQSDIGALAGTVGWVRQNEGALDLAEDAAEAIATARWGEVATLVVPADMSWADVPDTGPAEVPWAGEDTLLPHEPSEIAMNGVVSELRTAKRAGEPIVMLLGSDALRAPALNAASRVAAATGATMLAETFPARLERGAGVQAVQRLAYLPEMAARQLAGVRHLVLIGARSPVTFFGHPGRSGDLVPMGCEVYDVAEPGSGLDGATALAAAMGIPDCPPPAQLDRPAAPSGPLTAESAAAVIGALLPEGAIVVDESNTSGIALPAATAGAPRHDWLTLTGGAIGWGMPAATGAAIACPDRPVWSLQADGSAMYTISALWTQAREGLDVTTVLFNNAAYAILRLELAQTHAAIGDAARARALFDLDRPRPDFVALATGFGVPAERVETAEALTSALQRAAAEPGPHLIEAMVPPLLP